MKKKVLSIIMATAIAVTAITGSTVCFGTQDVLAATQSNVKVKLNKTTLILYKNDNGAQRVKLRTTVTGSNEGVKWKSSNKDVAKVSSSGVVTAVGNGTAVITVTSKTDNSAFAECKVSVNKPTKKVSAQKKVVRVDGGNNYIFNNIKITNYSQLKKVISNYEKKAATPDKKVLKQLKGYKKSFFDKKTLLLNTMPEYRNGVVNLGNVTKKLQKDGKFQIAVELNVKYNGGENLYPTDVIYNDCSFIEISKELSNMTGNIVYKENK